MFGLSSPWGQLLGTLPSDENAAAARTKSRGIYDQLASGKLNIAGLTAMGQGVLKETDSYAKERQEAPQFDPLIAQLTSLLAGR